MLKPVRFLLIATIVLTVASIACWLATLYNPGRFIFLPGGDVGLGFRSYAGNWEWIEYAPWDRQHLDTPWWSVPWWIVVSSLTLTAAFLAIRLRVIWLRERSSQRLTDDE